MDAWHEKQDIIKLTFSFPTVSGIPTKRLAKIADLASRLLRDCDEELNRRAERDKLRSR